MVLPLYLAMTEAEMCTISHGAFLMEDHFTPPPPGLLPVITDRHPLTARGVDALVEMARDWSWALLDFERPPTPEGRALARRLPCPAAAPPGYGDGPVFLPPPQLYIPLDRYLAPWAGREVWLEAALLKQTVTVTAGGTVISPPTGAGGLSGGFESEALRCRFTQAFSEDRAVFTLFDTPESLEEKLHRAAALGVTRAVGLYQELGRTQ